MQRRPTSVCFVIDRLSRAGTETQLLALLRDLDRRRVSPALCLLNGSDVESRDLVPTDCPVIDLRLGRLSSPRTLRAAAALAAFWARCRADVVQTYFLDSTYFAVPLARARRIRRVVRVRNNAGYWLTPRHRRLGRLVGRLAHLTLTNSDDARRAVVEAENISPDRVRVIENGVDLNRFAAHEPPTAGGTVVRVGAVANLRPVKNIAGLATAAVPVCRADPRVRFEVAGDGEERPRLLRQIAAAGLADRFILRGSVADIPAFLGRLDIAVLNSYSESMSNALLEYMASARAIVATDVGANGRLIRHEREGLLIPAGDSEALAGAIRRLATDPALARRLGIAARRRAAEQFSRTATVRRFEDFYQT